MKKILREIFISFSIVVVILIVAESYFFFKDNHFPIFYNNSSIYELTEIQVPLFKRYDINLGYSHNDDFIREHQNNNTNPYPDFIWMPDREVKILDNGFVKYSFQPNRDSAIVIAVLGNCSTDPFLFNGNWPIELHKHLTKLSIPHIIFNGAVSGYNTSQNTIKFIRDVIYIKPKVNIFISVDGETDYPEGGDVSINHPFIHPYQVQLAESFLVGRPLNDPKVLPNLQYSFFKLTEKKSNIQAGLQRSNYLNSYVQNIKIINQIAKINNIEFLHFIQAIDKKYLSHNKNLSIFFQKALFKLKESKIESHSLQIPELSSKHFIDNSNLTREGSKIVSNYILKVLLKSKISTKQNKITQHSH